MEAEYYRELVRPTIAGRRWILAGAPATGFTSLAKQLRELGAERSFIIASSTGTGDLPAEDDAEWVDLGVQAPTIMKSFRATQALLEDLPPWVREAVDSYDPERSAWVLGTPFLFQPTLADRLVFGYRRPEWVVLEDKVVVDAFWDGAGVRRPPSRVVAAEAEALREAAARLGRGSGTVWQGDAKEGFNGGAEYLRWVREEEDAAEAIEYFTAHCDRVRVTPFLEGIPCSIHGMVFPEVVVAFRPVEIVTLRKAGSNRLLYAGTATFWDPPDADRDGMRKLALRVGAALRDRVSYRGAFTVDGVMTEEGFLPTELNTRAGAGLGPVAGALPDLPFGSVNRALLAGEALDYRPEDFERLVAEAADAKRGGGGYTVAPLARSETLERAVVRTGAGYRPAEQGEEPDGKLLFGPSDVGGFVRFAPEEGRLPVGDSIAPRVVEAFRLADRLWKAGLGPLEPARDVRSRATA